MHLVLDENSQTSNKNGSRDFKTLIELNGSNFDVDVVDVVAVAVVAVPKLGKNHFFTIVILGLTARHGVSCYDATFTLVN